MFFSDYSEFLQSQQEMVGFVGSGKELKFPQSSSFMAPPVLGSHHDLVYSEFTEVISKRLVPMPYPNNFHNTNPFCPLCLKLVISTSAFLTCFINNERNYLIHDECLRRNKAYELRNVGQIVENALTFEECPNTNKYQVERGLDSRYFFLEMAIVHPINDKNFMKINKKVSLVRDHFNISLNETDTYSTLPNIVLLPLTDFHLTINLTEVGKRSNHAKFTHYLSLRGLKEKKRMRITCEQVSLEVQLITNDEEKLKLVDRMNYKFKYPIDNSIQLLRIYSFKVGLPEEFEESDQDQQLLGRSSTLVDNLLNEKENSLSAIKTSQPSPTKNRFSSLTDSNSSNELQPEKVNLSKLISTNTLVDFVKNNIQSRLFQNFLGDCNSQDINLIIQSLKTNFADLITHEYGNYMVQKLFIVCSPLQRLAILNLILPQLCELVRNKQGTHTIQAFISYFTLPEQFSAVSLIIMNDFYQLSRNNNATHFIQKFLKTFPIQYTLNYFHFITENLLAFALDKNAMCVIKHMMRQIRQIEVKQEIYAQNLEHIKRQLIFNVTFNVDRLIMDCYGNYVIQFCYEMFDLERCSGITERILYRFGNYCVGKFASNVLLKCVSLYWSDKKVYRSLRSMTNTQILDIFRNKDGNKVLLEIMEKLEGIELWDRLYGILLQVEPTRYYHDRWGVCLGSRSGQVGTRFNAFPQARKRNYNKRY